MRSRSALQLSTSTSIVGSTSAAGSSQKVDRDARLRRRSGVLTPVAEGIQVRVPAPAAVPGPSPTTAAQTFPTRRHGRRSSFDLHGHDQFSLIVLSMCWRRARKRLAASDVHLEQPDGRASDPCGYATGRGASVLLLRLTRAHSRSARTSGEAGNFSPLI